MASPRRRTVFPSSDDFPGPHRGRSESRYEGEKTNPKRKRLDDDPLDRDSDQIEEVHKTALSKPIGVEPSTLRPHQGNPWEKYVKLLEEDHAGLVTMAWTREGLVVAVKTVKLAEPVAPKISSLKHPNIVGVHEAFMDNSILYLVNEYMAVSLADVAVSPWRLGEKEVAAICEGILHGLVFIHDHLHTNYGPFTCEDILLAHSGKVKLANFGELFLHERGCDNDAKSVAGIVVELLEPGTCIDDIESVELSESAPPAAREFVHRTKLLDASALLKERFIKLSMGPYILFRYVEFTRKIVSRSWGLSPDAPRSE